MIGSNEEAEEVEADKDSQAGNDRDTGMAEEVCRNKEDGELTRKKQKQRMLSFEDVKFRLL